MPKYDLPQNQISNYLRYQELFLKSSRTPAEETEFQNLQNTLSAYLITANDWNTNVEDHIVNKQTHGISGSYYIAKTSRSDQLPTWDDLQGKPSSSVANIDDAVNKRHLQNTDNTLTNTSANTINTTGTGNIVDFKVNGVIKSSIDNSGNFTGGASKLITARTISLTGDATGSTTFDGSNNASIAVTLSNSGVTAGTYTKVTVDAKGRVTSGTTLSASDIPNLDWSKITSGKPTTLTGYGITDAILNAGSTPSIQAGLDANKPSAGIVGRLYIATDTKRIYRDNGSGWDILATDAGTISGYQVSTGTTANTIPVRDSNGKLPGDITGNADTVDGYHVGNNSGQIPISNGTLNTNLNADKLDGYHADTGTTANTIPVRNASGQLSGDITGNAATATKLQTARTISLTGDATGSTTFDGSADKSITVILANSGVTAGTYTKVTVDSKGRVTSGSNPTTLSGYGITDGVQNAGNTPSIQAGLDSAKPAAGTVGRIYIATDTKKIYRDNGTSWDLVGGGDADTVDGLHASSFLQYGSSPNTNGYFDTSTTAPTGTQRLNYSGYFYATKVYNAVFNDYAEYFEKGEEVEAGDVIMLGDNGKYVKAVEEYSNKVVGVCSRDYGICIGGNGDENDEKNFIPIALAGRVPVKVTGEVRVGDLLTVSDIPGVAKSVGSIENYVPGTVIGKALESFSGLYGEIGLIKMLVMLC